MENQLADGSPPKTPAELFERLRVLGISCQTIEHPPVFTVEEAKALRGELEGCHTKNLFLRDKRGAMCLVVCSEDREVDLKDLALRIGANRLSFGSAERLMKYLGVIPGAVTPFAVINDTSGAVRVVLDSGILERGPLNFHPLDNAKTTSIKAEDFMRFLETENHPPILINLDARLPIG